MNSPCYFLRGPRERKSETPHTQMKSNPSSNQSRGKATGKKQPKKQQPQRSAVKQIGAAVTQKTRQIGMRDLKGLEISFLAGYVYVGNGTLGNTDDVYIQDTTKTYINKFVASTSGYQAGVSLEMTDINQRLRPPSYVTDVVKHFSRYRVRSVEVELVSLQPATSNSMIAQISPVRGAGDSASLNMNTGIVAGATLANTIGMTGSRKFCSWESGYMDFTPYVAGGFGPRQDEFTLDVNNGTAIKDTGIPCALVVSGQNSTAGLRGTQTHAIVYRFCVDLLDFVAGITSPDVPAAMLLTPTPELVRFLDYLGGPPLLKLLEAKQQRVKEEQSLSGCC